MPAKESQFRFQSKPQYDSVAPLGVSIPRVVLQVDSPGPEKGILHPPPLNSLTYDIGPTIWNMETSGNWIQEISIP